MTLINIGHGSLIAKERIIAVLSPASAPIKRLITEARDRGELIDATYGRKTKSVVVMDSDHVIISSIKSDSIARRIAGEDSKESEETDDE